MAKTKHSTALFEVIHSGRRSDGRSGNSLRTPKWWFKGRPNPPRPVPVEARPAVAPEAADPAAQAEAVEAAPEPVSRPAPAPRQLPPMGRSAIQFDFDRELQEITLRLRYTTAIVSGFAVLVVIALAYVVGRHLASGPQAAYASPSTEALLHLPAEPSALDVPLRSAAQPSSPLQTQKAGAPAPAAAGNEVPAPAPVPGSHVDADQRRSLGLNYIIVQSYPSQKGAEEARDFLLKQGIGCTVEKGPRDWVADPAWCSVITTVGFQRIHSGEYEMAARKLTQLGEKFANGSHFKRFEPHPYKWK